MRRTIVVIMLVATSSCSLAFQDSVSGRSVYCSDSHFWYVSDLLIGGALTYVATKTNGVSSAVYAPGALMIGSGAIGAYKRHNCARWRETAPPEEWARMAAIGEAERQAAAEQAARDEEARQEAARVAAEQAALVAQQQADQAANEPPPPVDDETQAPPTPNETRRTRPRPSGPPINVFVERHSATDEIGKSCRSDDAAYPQAGGCSYGAVCYRRSCTVWCGNDGSCPAGKRCAITTGRSPTKLCQ